MTKGTKAAAVVGALVSIVSIPAAAQAPTAPTLAPTLPPNPALIPKAAPASPGAPSPPKAPPPAAPRTPVPVVPRAAVPAPPLKAGEGLVNLVAMMTEDGQRIDQGMVWHVFRDLGALEGRQPRHVSSVRGGNAAVRLPAGDYVIVGSFGRATATRRVRVVADQTVTEMLVLNAGGLRLQTTTPTGEVLPANQISIDVFADERDQGGNRLLLVGNVKPGVILRLNSGIYHLVSTYGDANAQVRADVTVEAGKLTEAGITHHAGRVTLKLVGRAGGEALADTQWTIATPQGAPVKESVGAFPTHLLAPGNYTAVAKNAGRTFRRDFTVRLGDVLQVEVLAQ